MSIQRTNANGTTSSIPLDPANSDYAAWLKANGRTHADVLAEATAADEVVATAARAETDRRTKAARTGRAKLVALGLTRAEFRALFTDPDPDQ